MPISDPFCQPSVIASGIVEYQSSQKSKIMKKIYLLFSGLLLSAFALAQPTQSVAIQYYIDGNSNCSYDSGEQLIYNVQTNFVYQGASGTISSVSNQTFSSCSGQTLSCWGATTPSLNSITPIGGGILPNTACGGFNNIAYGTNSTVYLPVVFSGTSNLGVQAGSLIYASPTNGVSWQNVFPGDTIGICSNFGLDSLSMNLWVNNYLGCSNTNSMASRTYSFYFDNVFYDQITITGNLNTSSAGVGVNNLVNGWEYYTTTYTYLKFSPDLPSSYTVSGTHTLEVKSSMIYNNASSIIGFFCFINTVPCAKITGRFYNDCNNNCTFDAGDSYGVGSYATGLVYNASNGTNITFNPNIHNGSFAIYLPAASAYSLTQYPTTSSGYFTACSSGTTTIPAAASTNTFLFGYQNTLPANGDPSIYLYRTASTSSILSPQSGVEFGFQFHNFLWNLCTASPVTNPGMLKILLPKFINYVSTLSGPTPTLSSGSTIDTLIYAIPNFSNASNWWSLQAGTFSAVVSATAVSNTIFTITANIYPSMDINLANNSYPWIRQIDGPYDPNGKYTQVPNMMANGDIPFGTQEFIYEIGFQNIGKGPAINVLTLDTIDSNFDLASLNVLQSSFPVSVQKNTVTREVGFHFRNINLPGAPVNEPASHGFVRYSIKLKPNVPVNTILKNRAHNYFDFLEPVATNQTSNKLVVVAALDENGTTSSFVKAIPNPVASRLNLESSSEITSVKVYNLSGQLLLDLSGFTGKPEVDMQNLAQGIYLLKVTAANNAVTTLKVIKE